MARPRKKFFIDGPVQGSLVKRIILHWSTFFTLVALSIFAVEWFFGGIQLTLAEQLATIWTKYAFFFLMMLAILPTFIYDTIKLSHRFAGPIMRLKGSLNQMANGETVAPMHFREGDFWRELSDDFNRVAARLAEAERIIADETTTKKTDDEYQPA